MADAKMLARLHRVRTLQLTLAQAEERRAEDKATAESSLADRIGALIDGVAPTVSMASGLGLGAAATYRDRLRQSADAAASRVDIARRQADRAAAATRAARQDQGAVEKLLDRARRDAMTAEMRKLEDVPGTRRNRHDNC